MDAPPRSRQMVLNVTRRARHLDSIYVTHYFYFVLKKINTDSVPQTFAHGGTTEVQTCQENCCFSIVRATDATTTKIA